MSNEPNTAAPEHEYSLEQLRTMATTPMLSAHLPDYYGAVKQLYTVLTERRASLAPAPAPFWVLEWFKDEQSQGYWKGCCVEHWTRDIDEATQFCRHQDVMAQFTHYSWSGYDVRPTEHAYIAPAGESEAVGRLATREDAERFIRNNLASATWESERLIICFEKEALIIALVEEWTYELDAHQLEGKTK